VCVGLCVAATGMPCLATVPVASPATYDIFEGTEQIQQLVIARAISGMRIE
jgi:hypothetical protein